MANLKSLYFMLLVTLIPQFGFSEKTFYDRTFFSEVFGQARNYRIFLPAGYESPGKRYPVIYYCHGHSDRYTLEHYDNGTDTVPKIADYVKDHDVIVVTVDGYVAEHYSGFYGGDPWDVREDGGQYDFGLVLHELVSHIDKEYRTLTDRRHRGISGLSMGGFTSLYLGARFPELIGSCSAFNPGPEFYVGDPGRRVLWRPKDHVLNLENRWVRLVRASGDFISQYHEETRDEFARAEKVKFEYRRDEYHKHAATSIAETFDFHMRAFQDATLNNVPEEFKYTSPFQQFDIWGYHIESECPKKSLIYLSGVRQGGLRVETRQWAPDGPAVDSCQITIRTAPIYKALSDYSVYIHSIPTGEMRTIKTHSDEEGRLKVEVDGRGYQIGINGPGTGSQPPVLLPFTDRERLYVSSGVDIPIPIRIFNPRTTPMERVAISLSSDYPTVQILEGESMLDQIEPGQLVDASKNLRARFTGGGGYYQKARLRVDLTYDGWHERYEYIDAAIEPDTIPGPLEIEIMDGREMTFNVFRQKGNQGGGGSIERKVKEGKGNGNGKLEPGEEVTIWVKMQQGMDPFDKNNWYRCKIRSDSEWLSIAGDIQEEKQLEWTGAMNRTSLVRLAPSTPRDTLIPIILENETWSYQYTPDVRYGTEPLYQAIQLHTFHLHRTVLKVD